MERVPVSSSNVNSVGYDEDTSTLEIEFYSGTYHYYDVPRHVFEELVSSSSVGSYIHHHIKGSYSYEQV
ncbi:KTSC domain-containing protein [Alteromonas sp. K632G]|nr:KTSC domain-containing protein [Alteromonas sp. K632G]